jgi:hypothetical protein
MEENELNDKEVLDKLLKLVDNKEVTVFNEEEVKTLKRVINIVTALDTLGSLGSIIKNVLMWLAFIIGIYLSVKNGLISWIIEVKQ